MIANSYNNPLIAMFDILSVWSSIDDLICTAIVIESLASARDNHPPVPSD